MVIVKACMWVSHATHTLAEIATDDRPPRARWMDGAAATACHRTAAAAPRRLDHQCSRMWRASGRWLLAAGCMAVFQLGVAIRGRRKPNRKWLF